MTEELQFGFLLRAQSALLLASLSEDLSLARQQRKAITRRLGQIFIDLVLRLDLPLVLEVGANEASFSRTVKSALPPSRVVAFEGHPRVYAGHASVVAEAGVEYIQLCVADREGEMVLKAPTKENGREKGGMGSLLSFEGFSSVDYPVKTITLDKFLGDAQLPNALWIDVEGATGEVLAGAERTLQTAKLFTLNWNLRRDGKDRCWIRKSYRAYRVMG